MIGNEQDPEKENMMTWQEVENRIRTEIREQHKGILKCRGNERRSIVSNNDKQIVIRTGVKTNNVKSVTYEMIKYAHERIASGEDFNSAYFQGRFSREYHNGQCLYSVVGGILVEMEEAERIPFGTKSCVYRKRR